MAMTPSSPTLPLLSSLLLPLLLLLSLPSPIHCQDFLEYTATITGIYPSYGSYAGGTQVTIRGSGFLRGGTAGSTTVTFGGHTCVEQNYYSTDTNFVCLAPSSLTFSDGSLTVPVQMTLLGTGYGSTAQCQAGLTACSYTYTFGSTPFLDTVVNDAVVAGSILTYTGLLTGAYYSQYDDLVGETRCIPGYQLTSPDNLAWANIAGDMYGDVTQTCQVSNQTAGRYLFTVGLRPTPDATTLQPPLFPQVGYGLAVANNQTKRVTDDGLVYTVVQAPAITGLSLQQGATTGGALLTLSGTSFSPLCESVAVSVGLTPATVLNCSLTSIVVQTSPSAPATTLEAAAATTGAYGSSSYAYLPSSIGSVYNGPPGPSLLLNGLHQSMGVGGVQTMSGLLIPPYTASYQFYVGSGALASFALSTDATPANEVTLVTFQGVAGSFYTQASQTGPWVTLQAGMAYHYTATVGAWQQTIAVRVHNPATQTTAATPFLPTDTAAHALYQSFPSSFLLTIAPQIVREVQTITVLGATAGIFQLSDSSSTASIPYPVAGNPADATTANAISNFFYPISGCYAPPTVTGFAVPATGSKPAGVAWNISYGCPTPGGGRPVTSVANLNLTASAALTLTWARTQPPSAPIGGAYRLGVVQDGVTTWSGAVAAFGGYAKYELQSTLSNLLGSLGSVTILSEDFVSSQSLLPGDGLVFGLQVTYVGGDASTLFVADSSALTGTRAAVTFQATQAGSLDRWYDPVPADWLATVGDQSQVTVAVNGIRALCGVAAGGAINVATWVGSATPAVSDCRFAYNSALVPTLTSVSPATATVGSVLTLTGAGFDATATANNVVTFLPQFTAYATPSPCAVTSVTSTRVVCVAPAMSSGTYRVQLQVTTAGYVDPASTPVLLTFSPTINPPNPLVLTGSIAGGSLLVLTGAGFHPPQSLSFLGNDSFTPNITSYSTLGGDAVTVGGQVCELEDVTFTLLICRVPAAAPQVAASVPVQVNGNAVATFVYASASTPQVSAVTPTSVSSAITTVVTITGSGFTVPAAYPPFFYAADTDNPYNLTIANHASTYDDSLFTSFAVHFGGRACTVLTTSATLITCQITRGTPVNPLQSAIANAPSVYVMGLGYAQVGEVLLELALQVDAVSPQMGSINGGQYLTISGAGFVAQATTLVTVDILANQQLSDYPSMTTSSVAEGGQASSAMHVMSLAEGEVSLADRFFPLQAHSPSTPQSNPPTAQSALDAVMHRMHHRATGQAHSIAQQGRRFSTLSVPGFAWTGYSIPCAITSITYTQVVCFTSATGLTLANFSGSGYTSIVGVVHVSINNIPSVCSTPNDLSQSCLYGFDTLHTPTITSVTPTSGGANTALTITGTSLGAALTSVLVGYDTCAVTSSTATSIVCTVPGNTASTVPVQVLFADVGFASNATQLTFTHLLSIAAITPTSGSYAGGSTITLTGSGFGAVTTDNVVTLNGQAAIVVSTSPTALVITTPPCPLSSADTTATLVLSVTGYYYASYRYPNVDAPSPYPVLGDDNAALVSVSNVTSQLFTYTASLTPSAYAVTPQSGWAGQALTITGVGFAAGSSVDIGGVACASVQLLSSTSITCVVGNTGAGVYPVNVIVPGSGMAYTPAANAATMLYTSQLAVSAVTPLASGYAGGVSLTLTGSGFGALPNQTVVSICNTNCTVQSVTYTSLICTTDALSTLDRIATYGPPLLTVASGTYFGAAGSSAAFDGDVQTSYIGNGPIGLDMGPLSLLALTRIRWYVPAGFASVSAGGSFQTSNDGSSYLTVATISAYPQEGWNYVDLISQTAGSTVANLTSAQRYFRYVSGPDYEAWMAEIEWTGYRVASVSSSITGQDVTQCPVAVTVVAQDPYESLQLNGAAYANGYLQTSFQVAYSLHSTPLITNIQPTNGSSLGGTPVTITGSGFAAGGAATVAMQGYPCAVTSVTSTSIVCTTSSRLVAGLSSTGWQIDVITGSQGRALLVQQGGVSGVPLLAPVLPSFRYLDRWSAKNTWAYDEPPLAGDTVVIPQGQMVLMDVTPPSLFVLLVQGVLVWDLQDGLGLTATYVWVNGGTFQLGTEAQPFPYHATITLTGDRSNTELPYIGSKVLAVDGLGMGIYGSGYAPYARWPLLDQNAGSRSDSYDNMDGVGVLDIHGQPRRRVWTKVTVGVYAAGSVTVVTDEVVDFAAGELLVFTDASVANNVEEVRVAGLSADGHTITLSTPLLYTHTSERYTLGAQSVDMRAEIAVLSRNVVIQGDAQSEVIQFGAHTMMMAGAVMRVENAEYRRCGQGFNLGRYCIHFHMAGDAHLSYAKSNSIHDGYQRAVTTHGVEYVEVWNNVAKDVKAHNFFIEDGGERQNVFEANLAINVQPLATLLQSDLEASGFWTNTPANIWRHNVVAGGQHAGMWYNAADHPTGPSATMSVCPSYGPLLEFRNNSFHHMFFGLQVYPVLRGYVNPCAAAAGTDRTSSPTTIDTLVSWRNLGGAAPKNLANVQFVNALFADNRNFGIDWSINDGVYGERPHVYNSLFVGASTPAIYTQAFAVWVPQTEAVWIANTVFANWGALPPLLTCDACLQVAEQSQSGYTLRTSGLQFVNTQQRIQFIYPYKDIVLDLDGSLTGIPNGTLTNNYTHNINPHCQVSAGWQLNWGIVCDASVRVRRLAISSAQPEALWETSINVTSYDTVTGKAMGWAVLPYHQYDFSGWVVPVVTGYRYSIVWTDANGLQLDFSSLVLRYSQPDLIQTTALSGGAEWVQLSFPYHTTRWQFEVDYPGNAAIDPAAQLTLGNSISVPWMNYSTSSPCSLTSALPFGTGCNDVTHNVYTVILTTNTNATLGSNSQQLFVQGLECPYSGCVTIPPPQISSTTQLWSDPATWASFNATIPLAGSSVTIPPTAWVIFDVVNAPAYDEVVIQGRLTFADTTDLELIASRILVTGDFEIGNASVPHVHRAVVTLVGGQTSPVLPVDGSQEDSVGNKVLAVFGNVSMYGQPVVSAWTRLQATVMPGATSMVVVDAVGDWTVGATVVVSSTEYDSRQREVVTITAITGSTLTFTPALAFRHYAGAVDYSATASITFAAKVGLLTRNVVIRGQLTAADITGGWGAHVVVSEIPSMAAKVTTIVGRLSLSYVALQQVGQGWTNPALLVHYFYGADNAAQYKSTYFTTHAVGTSAASIQASSLVQVVGCSFSSLYGPAIMLEGAANAVLTSNVIDTAYTNALKGDAATVNTVISNNLFVNAQRSPLDVPDHHHPISAIYLLSFPLLFTNNVVAGANDSALTTYFPSCAVAASTWSVEVHSISTGVWQLPEETLSCVQLSNIVAWKVGHIALYTTDGTASIVITNVVVSDSHMATSISNFASGTGASLSLNVTNSIFIGSSNASTCAASTNCTGVATGADLFGASASCGSAFGNAYRHIGLTSNAYYGRARMCSTGGLYAGAECDPINQFVYECALPLENRYGLPNTVLGVQAIHNVVFAHWQATECGGAFKSRALAFEPFTDSFGPEMQVSGVVWYKSDVAAKISTALTAQSVNCEVGCDGYDQFAMYDLDGSLLGGAAGATVVTANSRVPTNNPSCTWVPAWSGYQCAQTWRLLILQELAQTGAGIRLAPVLTTSVLSPSLNVTSFSVGPIDDYCALETYSNFIPFLALANAQTDWVSTGTMVPNALISVHSPVASERFLLTIFYTQPMQVSAFVNGVAATQLTTRVPTLSDPVGTYTFDPQARLLYLVLGGGSQSTAFTLYSSALIAVSMSLAVDFATFDGPQVVQYMSTLLNIDPSTIKLVSVHAGSTVADFTIAGPANVSGNATLNTQYLQGVAANLVTVVKSGQFTTLSGLTVTSMTVTPPTNDGSTPTSSTVASPSFALSQAEAAGLATGVVVGVVIAILVVLLFAACAGGYVVRQRRLAAASRSVYSAKEGIELPLAKLSEKMAAKRQPPPIVARKESIASTASSSQSGSLPQSSPTFFSTNAESRRESFATLNLDAPVEDDGRRYEVTEAYNPRFPQELQLAAGDQLAAVVPASESWFVATNERTGERGAVPRAIIRTQEVAEMRLRPTPPPRAPAAQPEAVSDYHFTSTPPPPPLPFAVPSESDEAPEPTPEVQRHTYVPADEPSLAEGPAVFYPPAARAPVVNLDRWERSRSQRNSLRVQGGVGGTMEGTMDLTPKTPVTPQPHSAGVGREEDEEAKEEEVVRPNVGVHRRVMSMEKRWKREG